MLNRWVLSGLLLMVMANGAAIYAAGVVDGMYLAPVLGAPADDKSPVSSIHRCLKDMTNVQVAAIITKYAKDHPEKWHMGANILGHEALRAVCPVE